MPPRARHRAALESKTPVLAICPRHSGAERWPPAAPSACQDVPTAGAALPAPHRIDKPKDFPAHQVARQPREAQEALLAPAQETDASRPIVEVNSRHHQAVAGALAPGTSTSAAAADGVIRGAGAGRSRARSAVGVQWHPENFGADRRFP